MTSAYLFDYLMDHVLQQIVPNAHFFKPAHKSVIEIYTDDMSLRTKSSSRSETLHH